MYQKAFVSLIYFFLFFILTEARRGEVLSCNVLAVLWAAEDGTSCALGLSFGSRQMLRSSNQA